MLYRLTFRMTNDHCLQVTAHPDKGAEDRHLLVADHEDPTVFTTALGLAGVSTVIESDLAIAAGKAWDSPGIDVCCEAADLMNGQLETLGFQSSGS